MTVARGLLIIGMLVTVGLAVVTVRGASAKSANRIQRVHERVVMLEHKLWTHEMSLAGLRKPEEIRKRAAELELDLVPPVGRERR